MPNIKAYEDGIASHIDSFLATTYGGRTPEVVSTEVMQGVNLVGAIANGGKDVVIATSIPNLATTQGTPIDRSTTVGPHVASALATVEVQVYAPEWEHARAVANDVVVALSNARVAVPNAQNPVALTYTRFVSSDRVESPPNTQVNGYSLIFAAEVEIGDTVWTLPAEDRASVGFPAGAAPSEPLTRVDIGVIVDGTQAGTISETRQ